MCYEDIRSFKFVVTGSFTYEDYLKMSGDLVKHASIRSTFFAEKGRNTKAAATFYVSTQEHASRLEDLLRHSSGTIMNKVIKECNDAAADTDDE
jgi:hypothetical protein